MKSTWLLLVGIAIGCLGTGTYFSYSTDRDRPAPGENPAPPPTSPRVTAMSDSRKPTPATEPHGNQPRHGDETPAGADPTAAVTQGDASAHPPGPGEPSATTRTRPLVHNLPRTEADAPLSRAELAARAARIEQQATRELERLTLLLDLSEEQQDRIFPLLARRSAAFHPALAIQIGDTETGAPRELPDTPAPAAEAAAEEPADAGVDRLLAKEADEAIHELLTPEQQEELEEEIIAEDLWWTDIVAELEDDLDESVEVAAADRTTTSTTSANLADLLDQAARQTAKRTTPSPPAADPDPAERPGTAPPRLEPTP